ncbi:glycerophosphodiester phosphodiesterase [Thalassotalea litorea]|uniref:Glycerophosphodiester phosphodiesterase n=1 Tax=Thalassotalea litorea TaxID=2020715 RepID=A0A5R9IV50_9GAMM|nr:glycerophosphodiester phosphodiesterase family protein [Thalassotalea litorea]TLU65828.1 glycerophosphodiester phosphodiesterase [Thalassotalea litorea]
MLVFAHRGASGHEPENTLLAIKRALAMQVDAIEIDVHLLADGELVVTHDRWLKNQPKVLTRIRDLTLAQVKKIDVGKGQAIPTLDEVLECVAGQCLVNIELKAERTVIPLMKVMDRAIANWQFQPSQFLLSSFNHHLLFELKTLNQHINTGALTASCPLDYAAFAKRLDAYSVHIDIDFVNQEFVNDAHERGLMVYVYTVDNEADIVEMHHLGVDGIFSNYPTRSLVKIAHLQTQQVPELNPMLMNSKLAD